MKFVAILSTTILPIDGVYEVYTAKGKERQDILARLAGIVHYIGHPDTKSLVEALGAIPSESKLFSGLKEGESAICFPIKQGLSTRKELGFTVDQAISEIETLDVRVIRRLATNGEYAYLG